MHARHVDPGERRHEPGQPLLRHHPGDPEHEGLGRALPTRGEGRVDPAEGHPHVLGGGAVGPQHLLLGGVGDRDERAVAVGQRRGEALHEVPHRGARRREHVVPHAEVHVVGDADLPNAVALNSTSITAAQMIGPAVAGLLIASVGLGWAFLLNGLSFAAVLLSMSFFRLSDLHGSARAHRNASGFMEGFRYVRRRPDLSAILVMLFLIGTFGLNFPIYISTMAVNVFHSDARAFGLLSSLMAVGTVAGALFAASRQRQGMTSLLVGTGFFGIGCTLAALAPGYWWFAAALMITGAAALIFGNATNSIMQLSTEPAMRGRVMALRVAIALGGTPIGAPMVGWVANHFGPRWALGIGAAAGFTAALVAVNVLARRKDPMFAQ